MSDGTGHDPSCLIRLQAGSSDRPLVCVHEVAGLASVYGGLVAALGPEYTVVGLQAFWLKGGREPLASIEAMARYYAHQVRLVQRKGPYILYGWSSGGLIALEMARELSAGGDDVAAVALGDTQIADETLDPAQEATRRWKLYVAIACGGLPPDFHHDDHPFWTLSETARLADVLDRARRADRWAFLALIGMCPIEAHFAFFWGFCEAVQRYRPRPYPGAIVFFEATRGRRRGAAEAWASLARDGCRVVPIDADHVSMMRPPALETIAQELRRLWQHPIAAVTA